MLARLARTFRPLAHGLHARPALDRPGRAGARLRRVARVELEAQLQQRVTDRPLRVSLDRTIVKVHQDGTGGAPTGVPGNRSLAGGGGGLTTRLHALVLEDHLPLILTLTPGHWGDATWGRRLLERLGRNCSPTAPTGRCNARPGRGTRLGVSHAAAGQPRQALAAEPAAYRARNTIERYFGRIKRMRGIANRYHRLARCYFNQILLSCIHITS